MGGGTARSRRRKPKQDRSAALVDAVVEAAAQLLVSEGPSTTTNRIAERAGVSVGSIYQYFGDKQAVFEAVGARHIARLSAVQAEMFPVLRVLPPSQALPAAVRGLIAVERVDPVLGGVLNRMMPAGRAFAPIRVFETSMEQAVADYLRSRVEEGDIDVADPELSAKVIIRATSGVVRVTLETESALVEEERFVEELVALVEGYLGGQHLPG